MTEVPSCLPPQACDFLLKGRLETIEGFLRAGIGWPVIRSATGIDEQTYRAFKRDSANGAEQAAPR